MKARRKILGGIAVLAGLIVIAGIGSSPVVRAAEGIPQVELNADNLAPRPIEELTSKVVPRDYAHAWQTLAEALDGNRADLLNAYFTGLAKENFTSKIADQKRTGLHTHFVDHGHKLDGVFYAPAGDAMQLRDQARLEVQLLDGTKVVHSETLTQNYIVLMTPGADRWLVRDLEPVQGQQ